MCPLQRTRSPDAVIYALAEVQHRVVARWQVVGQGVDGDALRYRLRCGRLRVIHPGVYLVGPGALTKHGRWMAAVLKAGKGAVLSHRSAAALWGLVNERGTAVHVTAPRKLKRRNGITPHFARLPFDEVTVHHQVPTTTVPRTLADLAATEAQRTFTRALEQAEINRLRDPLSLADLLQRDPRRRGATKIREALEHLDTRITKEELERRFRSFVDDSSLPPAQTNASLGPYEVDVLWPDAKLVVELDSREHHLTSFAFERDRERDRALATMGYLVVRITWRQLHEDAAQLERDLRTILAERTRR